MPDPLLYLNAMGAAAVVSAVFVLAIARVRCPAGAAPLNLACVLGMGLGLAVGCRVLSIRPTWPPVNALDRLLMIVVPAVLGIELIAGFQCVPRRVAWFLRLSLVAMIPGVLLHGSVYWSDSGNDGMWQVGTVQALSGALLAGEWALLSRLSQRSPGVSIPLAIGLTTQCAGLTVMMAGYIKGGAAAFPLVATLVATSIGTRLMAKRSGAPANSGAPAILGIGVVELFGLLFIGRFFGRLSTGSALVMLLAPLLCWMTEIPQLRHRRPWQVGALGLVLVALPLLAVLVVAKRDFDRELAPLLRPVQRQPG